MLYLEVACNDPDNGIFAGRAFGLQIGEAEFESTDWRNGHAFAELDGAVRLSGKIWKICGSKEWFGNWCWNRYELYDRQKTTRWYLVDFVTWLRSRRIFNCTTAPSEFFDWFNGDKSLAPKNIHRLVCDLETERGLSSLNSTSLCGFPAISSGLEAK
jgi:hypothetical protein